MRNILSAERAAEKGGAREWNDQPALTLPSTPNYQFPTPKIG